MIIVKKTNKNIKLRYPTTSFRDMIPKGNFWYISVNENSLNIPFCRFKNDNIKKKAIGIIAAITWCSVNAEANIPKDINAIESSKNPNIATSGSTILTCPNFDNIP